MIKDYEEGREAHTVNPPVKVGHVYRFTAGTKTGRYFVGGGYSKEPHSPDKLSHIIYLATVSSGGGWDLAEDVFGESCKFIAVSLEEVYLV